MGRRKHRYWKLEMEARNRVDWMAMPRPLDWNAVFGRQAPLEVEIGFGNGEYLAETASDNPRHDFVGIEVKGFRLKKALWRLERRQVENVRLLLADARVALERLFRERSIRRVHSLFCDPWPKSKHEKYRLFSSDFLRLLNSRLEADGGAFIVTDDEAFSQWILEQVPETGLEAAYRLTPPAYGTKFEQKWRQERGQQRFHEILLNKRRHLGYPLIQDIDLHIPSICRFDPESFSPGNARGDVVVQFRRLDWHAEQNKARLLTVTVDGPLVQHVWLQISQDQEGWSLRPESPDRIIPTPALQRALDLAAAACS